MRTRQFVAAAVLAAVLGCANAPTSPAVQETEALAASVATAALMFYQMSGGGEHTCALTSDNAAWCWGYNASGQLGAGIVAGPESCSGAVGPFPCSTWPVRVAGGLRFRGISAGEYHTCAVTTDYRGYCWGSATTVGDGTVAQRPAPVAVAGGYRFRQVDAGLHFTCGVSYPDNQLYCWGTNSRGQLGDGSLSGRLSPVLVLGGLRFRQVSAGGSHACGVTTTNRLYCWGDNRYGQLGDSTTQLRRTRPVKVAGGHEFRQVDAGGYHTCAVTTDYHAYCWGRGQYGQIGNGKTYLSYWPRAAFGRVERPAGHGRHLSHLRRDHRQPGLVLGQQFLWSDRQRRHPVRALPQAGRRSGRALVRPDERRGLAHVRQDCGRRGVLLGLRLLRAAG